MKGATWLVLAAALASAAPVSAQPARQSQADARRIALFVAPGAGHIEPEQLRRAVARELGTDVVLRPAAADGDALSVVARRDDELVVTYRTGGRSLSRRVSVAERSEDAVETVALLAGNMVRDQASEVIDELRARRTRAGASDAEATAVEAEPLPAPQEPPARAGTVVVVLPPAATPKPAPAKDAPKRATSPCSDKSFRRFPIGGDFVPYLGSSMYERGTTTRSLSVNALGGYAGGLNGAEAGGLVNYETRFACGAQAAGIADVVTGPMTGAQAAGIANVVTGPVTGVQAAGIANVSADAAGVQVAGIANVSTDLEGAQVGMIDVAHDVRGAQVGLVNVARGAVHGVQVGLVNYADDSDVSLGLVSIVRKGRTRIDAWAADWQLLAAGVKHGGRHFYNVVGVGARPGITDDESVRPVGVLGLGAHFDLSESVLLDADVLGHVIVPTRRTSAIVSVASVRAALGLRLSRQLAIWGGPTYNVASGRYHDLDLSPMREEEISDNDVKFSGWPGAVLGVEGL